jgi:hypothetical protein
MIDSNVRSKYHRLRRAGWRAEEAIRAARILERWDKAESDGLVRLQAIPDEDWTIKDNGCSCGNPVCQRRERESFERDGAWGSVGEYRTDTDSEDWTHADSVWGHVGYNDVLSPLENPYILDIMAATLDALDAQAIAPGL